MSEMVTFSSYEEFDSKCNFVKIKQSMPVETIPVGLLFKATRVEYGANVTPGQDYYLFNNSNLDFNIISSPDFKSYGAGGLRLWKEDKWTNIRLITNFIYKYASPIKSVMTYNNKNLMNLFIAEIDIDSLEYKHSNFV